IVKSVTRLQRKKKEARRFHIVTFVTFLTGFMRNKLSARLRLTCPCWAGQLFPGARCRASEHLPEIRAESERRAHRKYFFESGSKPLRQRRKTAGLVPRQRRGEFSKSS